MAARTQRLRGPHAIAGRAAFETLGLRYLIWNWWHSRMKYNQASINETEDLKLSKKNKHRKPHVYKKSVFRGNNNSSTTSTY